jgi:hypothetical protein
MNKSGIVICTEHPSSMANPGNEMQFVYLCGVSRVNSCIYSMSQKTVGVSIKTKTFIYTYFICQKMVFTAMICIFFYNSKHCRHNGKNKKDESDNNHVQVYNT